MCSVHTAFLAYQSVSDGSLSCTSQGIPSNGYAESFHSRLRDELLNAELFAGLRDAKALGYQTPTAYAASLAETGNRTPDTHSNWYIKRGQVSPW